MLVEQLHNFSSGGLGHDAQSCTLKPDRGPFTQIKPQLQFSTWQLMASLQSWTNQGATYVSRK
tara:strand:- start:1452 stop:1640 length:189 start_codon:yes stop_codon:yes gene_type:complete